MLLFVMLAFVLYQMLKNDAAASIDVKEIIGIIAGLLCNLYPLHEASSMHDTISGEARQRAQKNLDDFRTREAIYLTPVPPPQLATLMRYYPAPDRDRAQEVARQLLQEQVPFDPLLLENEERVCVLFLSISTTTAELALWLCAHLQRMREKCGRDYPWKRSDTEIALYRYLVSLMRSNGYKRHGDLIGLRDGNTGLPLVISHRYHPLGTSLAAHDRRG